MESCPVCYDKLDAADCVQLEETCGHGFCQPCLVQWFETVESSGACCFVQQGPQHIAASSRSGPPCPQCRQCVHEKDVFRVLGRSLVPTRTRTMEEGEEDYIDEFTRTWLTEQGAQQCPGCGVWITLSEGCRNMMCRCGHRFNFETGVSFFGDLVEFSYFEGTFYDNIRMGHEDEFSGFFSASSDVSDEGVRGYFFLPELFGDVHEEVEDSSLVPLFLEDVDDEDEFSDFDIWEEEETGYFFLPELFGDVDEEVEDFSLVPLFLEDEDDDEDEFSDFDGAFSTCSDVWEEEGTGYFFLPELFGDVREEVEDSSLVPLFLEDEDDKDGFSDFDGALSTFSDIWNEEATEYFYLPELFGDVCEEVEDSSLVPLFLENNEILSNVTNGDLDDGVTDSLIGLAELFDDVEESEETAFCLELWCYEDDEIAAQIHQAFNIGDIVSVERLGSCTHAVPRRHERYAATCRGGPSPYFYNIPRQLTI